MCGGHLVLLYKVRNKCTSETNFLYELDAQWNLQTFKFFVLNSLIRICILLTINASLNNGGGLFMPTITV